MEKTRKESGPAGEVVNLQGKKRLRKPGAETSCAIRLETYMVEETTFPYNREDLSSTWNLFSFALSLQKSDIEKLLVCHLNGQNKLNCLQIFQGTLCSAHVYPREIIKHSLLSGSAAIVLAHNHPSGNLEFSKNDISLTQQIKGAAALFDITVHDHILLGGGKYVSMCEKGIISGL